MNSIPVLVEAKKEYTNQLQQILSPRLYEGFKSIYNDILKALSDDMIQGNQQMSSVTKTFQKSLKDIPLWNNEMIKNEYNRIEKISNCDYFENLIEAVFITNTKILTSVQINNNDSVNIKINVPQPQHFIHKCYIECSKEIYKNPYIFDLSKTLTPKEKHSNLRESLNIINHSISNAIRDLLPIRDILKQGLMEKSAEETSLNNEDNDIEFQEKDLDNEETGIDNMNDDDSSDEDENNNDNNDNNLDEDFENNNEEEINEINEENNNEFNTIEKLDEVAPLEDNIVETKDIIVGGNNIENTENLNVNNDISGIINQPSDSNTIQLDNTSNEPKLFGGLNNDNELKEINLTKNSIIKKIDNVEKVEKIQEPEKKEIEELIKPIQNNSNIININPNIRKIRNKNFIKKKLLGSKVNSSFYQKKYDENLANYNYTSESYLDDDDNNLTKNKINVDYNSSDDEENNPIELV